MTPDAARSRTRHTPGFVVLLVPVLLMLMGCAQRGEPYQPVQLGANEAAIYLYRPRSMFSPGPVLVSVDQQDVVRLLRNTHAAVVVTPGEHLVRAQRWSDATRRVYLGSGESLYLEVGAAMLGGKVSLSNPGDAEGQTRIAATGALVPPIRLGEERSRSADER